MTQKYQYERSGSYFADDRARTDKQAGADDAADRDHREVALLQSLFQVAFVAGSVRHGYSIRSQSDNPTWPFAYLSHHPAPEGRGPEIG